MRSNPSGQTRRALDPMTRVLIRRLCEDTERHTGRMPCDDGDRAWSDASTSQGLPRIAGNHPKLGEKHEHMLPQSVRKERSADTLISDI